MRTHKFDETRYNLDSLKVKSWMFVNYDSLVLNAINRIFCFSFQANESATIDWNIFTCGDAHLDQILFAGGPGKGILGLIGFLVF